MSRDRALVGYAMLSVQNDIISMKCLCSLNVENKVTTTSVSILRFHALHCWQETWPLSQHSASTTSQEERIPPITPQQPLLLNSDPYRWLVMKTKGFLRQNWQTKSLGGKKKLGDTLALEKKNINYLFINIIMVLRRMS